MTSDLITFKVSRNDSLLENSQRIPIVPGRKYRIVAPGMFRGGQKYSAMVAAMAISNSGREVKRYIRWVSDFEGNRRDYSIVFVAPTDAEYLVIGYRVNSETPVHSETEVEIPKPSAAMITEINTDEDESYDSFRDYEVPALPKLTEEQEEELERNIVWLFGAPRSGTTWLAQLLGHHDENVLWLEPFVGALLGASWSNRLYDAFYEDKPDFFLSNQHMANWIPQLRSLVLMRAYSHAQTLNKKIIIKEALGSSGADIIMKVLKRTKLLFIIRDGRDSVDSNLDTHSPGSWREEFGKPPAINTPAERIHWIREYSNQWVVLNRIILRAYYNHEPILRLMVKYEDLKKNTHSEMRRIYSFLNIKISERELNEIVEKLDFKNIPPSNKGPGKFYRAASVGGWKANFDDKEKEIMNSIMGKTLKEMGYQV